MREPDDTQIPAGEAFEDEFFVGYHPAPERLGKFMLLLVLVLMVWGGAMSIILVLTMRTPGVARWESGQEQTWSGVLVEQPYPMLVLDHDKQPSAMLVVSMGKHDARQRLEPFYDHRVQISGYELRREGRHIIELGDHQDAISLVTPEPVSLGEEPLPHQGEPLTLRGEIVDGKCYLGAMKPGDGNGHRACATLCLRGGLPPMFVARTEYGDLLYYLLVIDGSTTLPEDAMGLIACEVQVEGQIALMHGIPILLTSVDGISAVHSDVEVAEAMP